MRKHHSKMLPVVAMLMMAPVATIRAQGNLPLKLIQKITIPDTQGRFDHIDVDVDGKRLFVVTADKGSMEVLDLAAGKWMRSIAGLSHHIILPPSKPVHLSEEGCESGSPPPCVASPNARARDAGPAGPTAPLF